MKLIRIFFRNVRDSFKSVFRNFSLSLASISCITITLIVVAISILLTTNVNNFAELIEKDVTIVTFLKLNITEEERNKVEQEIRALDNVESYTFESKQEISNSMMEDSETFKSIMEQWNADESPIQDTFRVKVDDIKKIEKTADDI